MSLITIIGRSPSLPLPRAAQVVVRSHFFSTTSLVQRKKLSKGAPTDDARYYVSDSGRGEIRKLGFHDENIVIQREYNVLTRLMKAGISPRRASELPYSNYIEEDDKEYESLLRDRNVMGYVYALMGYEAVEPVNLERGFRDFALYCLATAMETEHVGATCRLWQIENARNADYEPPTKMLHVLKGATEKRRSWQPISLYLHHQLQNRKLPGQSRQANYALARDLVQMVTAGKLEGPEPLYKSYTQPWKLLYEAAIQYDGVLSQGPEKDEVAATFDEAIRIGAEEYKDPEAVSLLADTKLVELHSQKWVDLKTQSAMAGDPDDCKLLGKYWLEKTGWYPTKRSVPKHPFAQLGFEWMELAATLPIDDAEAMYDRSMLMALILRENRQFEKGRICVGNAIDAIDVNALNRTEAARWIKILRDFYKHWSDPLGATAASAWNKVGN